ncbi:hypothetical protein EVAR_8200_1 [Eumeta japonica]|uniref:Uncharacterized protein n=1 Tax=Eumeta variegata TaxID=151549 RepID=A0A4C1TGN1_EUMVA|nr:hypothetical protein EVAR_8200_1 [Eumeta japonica]
MEGEWGNEGEGEHRKLHGPEAFARDSTCALSVFLQNPKKGMNIERHDLAGSAQCDIGCKKWSCVYSVGSVSRLAVGRGARAVFSCVLARLRNGAAVTLRQQTAVCLTTNMICASQSLSRSFLGIHYKTET